MKDGTVIVILAAGNSSRMGRPKQLLPVGGKSLLRRVVDEALAECPASVIVVTGAYEEAVAAELNRDEVTIVRNPDWAEGMGTSIRVGMEKLQSAFPEAERCILAVSDQPKLTAGVFRQLKQQQLKTGKGMVASYYAGAPGTPVLFTKGYFNELRQLDGTEGAKKLLILNPDDLALLPFDGGETDIDTMEDYHRFSRQMITVEEAKRIISENISWQAKTPRSVGDATGFTLATDVIAALDIPNFRQSSMDGYAIRFEDKDLPLAVIGEMSAGTSVQLTIAAGQATRIFTGAPLPLGADTVVMQEKVAWEKDTLLCCDDRLANGQNVRLKGAEIQAGEMAMKTGTYLSAAAVGFLAGIGCREVEVWSAPRVGIVLTGNELQRPGEPLAFGQVYESNSAQLAGALRKAGIEDVDIRHATDDPAVLKDQLERSLEQSDFVLLVGGISVGDYDFVARVVAECGVVQQFHRIRQKPGKPIYFGTKEGKVVFGLPGNPSSALTCFYEYVLPAIGQSMKLPSAVKVLKAKATHGYRKPAGLTHFLKSHFQDGAVTPLHAQESFRLHSFAEANSFIVLDEASTGCEPGQEVEVHLLPL